jgi:hypothetical protein
MCAEKVVASSVLIRWLKLAVGIVVYKLGYNKMPLHLWCWLCQWEMKEKGGVWKVAIMYVCSGILFNIQATACQKTLFRNRTLDATTFSAHILT